MQGFNLVLLTGESLLVVSVTVGGHKYMGSKEIKGKHSGPMCQKSGTLTNILEKCKINS